MAIPAICDILFPMIGEEFSSAEQPEGETEIREIQTRRFIRDASRFVYDSATEWLREELEGAPLDIRSSIQESIDFLEEARGRGLELHALEDMESGDNTSTISLLAIFRAEMYLAGKHSEFAEEEPYQKQKEVEVGTEIFDEQVKDVLKRLVDQSPLFSELAITPEEQQKKWAEDLKRILEISGKTQALSSKQINEYLNAESITTGTADAKDIEDFKGMIRRAIEVDLPIARGCFIDYLAGKFTKNSLIAEIKGLMLATDILSAMDKKRQ